jgi:MraZ protein
MLRGSFTVKVDEKSRLKIPSDFRALIEQHHGRKLFITTLLGDCVQIYPMPVWQAIEERLAANSPLPPTLANRFFLTASYNGQEAEFDTQGRVLIHDPVRRKTSTTGEVVVVGARDHLEVWNHEAIKAAVEDQPLTRDELDQITKMLQPSKQ